MPVLKVSCVRRESEGAVQLIIWDERLKRHRISWCPRWALMTDCKAGDRVIKVTVSANIVRLEDWQWLIENEQEEYREFLRNHA